LRVPFFVIPGRDEVASPEYIGLQRRW
jgi:hypothetical protein